MATLVELLDDRPLDVAQRPSKLRIVVTARGRVARELLERDVGITTGRYHVGNPR